MPCIGIANTASFAFCERCSVRCIGAHHRLRLCVVVGSVSVVLLLLLLDRWLWLCGCWLACVGIVKAAEFWKVGGFFDNELLSYSVTELAKALAAPAAIDLTVVRGDVEYFY